MLNIIIILIWVILMVVLAKNSHEAFTNYTILNEDKSSFNNPITNIKPENYNNKNNENNNQQLNDNKECSIVKEIKLMKEQNNFKKMPCESANNLQNVDDKCKKKYCNEIENCEFVDNRCMSSCEKISLSDELDIEKQCLKNSYCEYNSGETNPKKRCIKSNKIDIVVTDKVTINERCHNIDKICNDNKDCVKKFCKKSSYCELKNDKCVGKEKGFIDDNFYRTFNDPYSKKIVKDQVISNLANNKNNSNGENTNDKNDESPLESTNKVDIKYVKAYSELLENNLPEYVSNNLERKNYNEMNNYNSDFENKDYKKYLSKKNTNDINDINNINNNENNNINNNENDNVYNYNLRSNNSNQNLIVRKKLENKNTGPIIQQHIDGVGNIYAPEIVITG